MCVCVCMYIYIYLYMYIYYIYIMNIVSLAHKKEVTISAFDLNLRTRLAIKRRDMTF